MLLFVSPYLRGFAAAAHRFLALFCALFFLGIVWCDLGAAVNIPALVWHSDVILQGAAGFSITALFAYVWLVTYILDTRFHSEFIEAALERDRRGIGFRVAEWLLPRAHGTEADPDDLRQGGDGLRWYLGVTFLPCTLLLLLPAFFVVDGEGWFIHFIHSDTLSPVPPDRPYLAERWPFAVGVVVAVGGIRLVTWAGGRLIRRWLTTDRRKRLVRGTWLQGVAGAAFVALVILYALTVVAVARGVWQPPPIAAACMLLGLLVGLGGAAWFFLRYWAVLVFAVALGWLTYCNSPDYKLRFPTLDPEYGRLVNLGDFEEPVLKLDDLEAGDRAKEAERVARLVAALRAQRDPAVKADAAYAALRGDRYDRPERYPDLVALHKAARKGLGADETAALETWKGQFAGKPKLVLVTATGGANRSALWTAKVLHELHRDPVLGGAFPKHLRVITGASGGMVGATYYVGSLQDDGVLPDTFDPRDVAQDFLTPIINGLVFWEVPLLFVPTDSYDRDRGEMLDRAMEGDVPLARKEVRARLHDVFARSFADLAAGERAGWRPSLIFSPMLADDGRRVFISNRHVPFLTVNRGEFLFPASGPGFAAAADGGPTPAIDPTKPPAGRGRTGTDEQEVYSRPGVEFFALFPAARDRLRLSTAARMNATFPFLSPAVSLPTDPPRRVVDAGYFDNTGVSVAAGWLYEHADWVAANCGGVVVIQIRDSASHLENRYLALPAGDRGSVVPSLGAVVSAVGHARTASASYRNDGDLRKLSDYFQMNGPEVRQFFTTVVFERRSEEVGMSWYLSDVDKAAVTSSWDTGAVNPNQESLAKLQAWWKTH